MKQQITTKQRTAARLMREGASPDEALEQAGYAETTRRTQSGQTLQAPGMVAAAIEQAKLVAGMPQLSAGEQERMVRAGLVAAALTGEHADGSIKALELLGRDRRVGMFQAEGSTVVTIQIAQFGEREAPVLPEATED